jgi:hypothetical protein
MKSETKDNFEFLYRLLKLIKKKNQIMDEFMAMVWADSGEDLTIFQHWLRDKFRTISTIIGIIPSKIGFTNLQLSVAKPIIAVTLERVLM